MAGKRSGKTVVVKIGSSTLTSERGTFRLDPVAGLVAEICELQAQGHRMLLVSSGAVSSGMGVLRRKRRPTEVVDLQAAAAVGQGRLFHIYTELFAHEKVVTAQVLLTAFDVAARTQYLNARNTLKRLLDWKVVPIINENDTTSTDELCFGDNDALAAQVALLVKADLLVLLTDTDGLYTADPREDSDARLIDTVDDLSELECVRIGAIGPLGSGGMGSKVNSARIATSGGVETIIARGTVPGVLKACLAGEEVGTRFPARASGAARLQAVAALRQAGPGQGGGGRRRRQGPAGQGQPAARGRGRGRRATSPPATRSWWSTRTGPSWPRAWSATRERSWTG